MAPDTNAAPAPIDEHGVRELARHWHAIADAAMAAVTVCATHQLVTRHGEALDIANRAREIAVSFDEWATHLSRGWRPL